MFNNGIKNITDVKNVDFINLVQLLGNNVAINIKKQDGQDFSKLKIPKGRRVGQTSLEKY